MTTTIKYFGENSLAKLISLIKGMDLGDFTNTAGYAKTASVPTKVSDLTNDSGFITSSSLPTKVSDLTNDSGFITSASIPTVPTKTSDLTNDSGFLTSADMSGYLPTTGGTMTGRLLIERTTTAPADTNSEEPFATLAGSDLVKGTNPLSQRIFGIYVTDKTKSTNPDGRLATLECVVGTNGRMAAVLAAHKNAAGETDHSNRAAITAVWDENNKAYGLAPTPDLGDDSGKIATTEWIWDQFLPLAGGTLTGSIKWETHGLAGASTDHLTIQAGDTWNDRGAYIFLMEKNAASNAGDFAIAACDGTNTTILRGTPAGSLLWGTATVAMVSDLSSYLPLSGGTITGEIKRNGAVTAGTSASAYTLYKGGPGTGDGAYIYLYGKSHGTYPGQFMIVANDGTNSYTLRGDPSTGDLKWGGTAISLSGHTHSYLPLSGGTLTGSITRAGDLVVNSGDSSWVRFNGGSDNSNGAYLILYGKSHSSYPGQAIIRTKDASTSKDLTLKPDGNATCAQDGTKTAICDVCGKVDRKSTRLNSSHSH